MKFIFSEFEVLAPNTDDNLYFDVVVNLVMTSPAQIESVELTPCFNEAPTSAVIKLTETQFSWAYPGADDIINNAHEWAAEGNFHDHDA